MRLDFYRHPTGKCAACGKSVSLHIHQNCGGKMLKDGKRHVGLKKENLRENQKRYLRGEVPFFAKD